MHGRPRRRGLVVTAMTTAVLVASLAAGGAVVLARRRAAHTGHEARRSAARALSINCRSPSLGGSLPAEVYLPPGYSRRGPRYPVVYFL
ncbi:MAG TPA: hypothetical protein VE127_05630, partial [Solirubrobacteraceae bacterium]|nr:hypothetical protein [Solirubrobacteraceae bacterium]